ASLNRPRCFSWGPASWPRALAGAPAHQLPSRRSASRGGPGWTAPLPGGLEPEDDTISGGAALARPLLRRPRLRRFSPASASLSTEAQVADSSVSGRITRAEPVPVGRCVSGRYRILSELGSGAFGTVYRAEDGATGHLVAVRFLPPALASSSAAARSIQHASRSLPSVSAMHPALTRVLDYGETEGQAFVVAELVTGQSLSTLLSSTPGDIAQGLRLAVELGGALEALHNAGYVHGGLRPRNVVLNDDGQLKLLDVELCGLRDQLELTELVGEKPPLAHLSQEQLRQGSVTEKTDIYAFALVVYETLCGIL